MSFRKIFMSSIFFLAFASGCGSEDKKKDPTPIVHSESDILGSWYRCASGTVSSRKEAHIFSAYGVLEFKQNSFSGLNCEGQSINEFVVKGSFHVGENNALDLTYNFPPSYPDADPIKKHYRVFSILDDKLTITQNSGVGESEINRDRDFSTGSVMILTREPSNP